MRKIWISLLMWCLVMVKANSNAMKNNVSNIQDVVSANQPVNLQNTLNTDEDSIGRDMFLKMIE